MVKNIGIKHIQSHRLLVRDEMNLMTFVGQGFAQFSGQYTAAAESGITYNSYLHISAILSVSPDEKCRYFQQRNHLFFIFMA
jgi:hypothetical protein